MFLLDVEDEYEDVSLLGIFAKILFNQVFLCADTDLVTLDSLQISYIFQYLAITGDGKNKNGDQQW